MSGRTPVLGWRGIAGTLIEQGDGSIVSPKMNEVGTRTMESGDATPTEPQQLIDSMRGAR